MFAVRVAELAKKDTVLCMDGEHLVRLGENRLHLTFEEMRYFPSTWRRFFLQLLRRTSQSKDWILMLAVGVG